MFSWQLSEIFNNFFSLDFEKKQCYKKRGLDIYRKSNYETFCPKLRQDFSISRSENGLYKVLAVKKNHWKQ